MHRVLLQSEYGLNVCGVLGLTWVVFFFLLLELFEKVLKEFLALLPHVSFVFKEMTQVMDGVTLHQIWCACPFVDINSLRQQCLPFLLCWGLLC